MINLNFFHSVSMFIGATQKGFNYLGCFAPINISEGSWNNPFGVNRGGGMNYATKGEVLANLSLTGKISSNWSMPAGWGLFIHRGGYSYGLRA